MPASAAAQTHPCTCTPLAAARPYPVTSTHPPAPQVNFLLLSSVGVLLPLRLYLPCQLPFLLLLLRTTAQRCAAECSGGLPGVLAACADSPAAASAGGGVQGSCPAGTTAADVQRYYAAVARLIRRLSPRSLGRLPPAWRPGGTTSAGCLSTCFAVHGWLQAVGGVLFPLALLWIWEVRREGVAGGQRSLLPLASRRRLH